MTIRRMNKTLIGALFTMSFATLSAAHGETLTTLLSKGIVSASFSDTGVSRGPCIRLTLQKKGGAGQVALTVSLPPGTTITSNSKPAMEMVIGRVIGRVAGANRVVPAPEIVLRNGQPLTYILEAYPTGKPQPAPTPSVHFKIKGWDQVLGCILTTAHDPRVSERSAQAAVWFYGEIAEAANHGDNGSAPTPEAPRKWLPMTDEEWQLGKSIVAHCIVGP